MSENRILPTTPDPEWHSRGRRFDPDQLHQIQGLAHNWAFLFCDMFMPYFMYVLKSEDMGRSYIGHTSNLEKRLSEHNSGKSISTRNKGPWRLVYKEEYQTRSEAAKRERYFKSVDGRMELKAKGFL